ncbi:MAG: ABC transporter permease [Aerococcus sp.]|nr:ABC transporter permease [Aerococcus sp.]
MKTNRTYTILVPILSIVLGFIVGAVIMLMFGYNPITAYSAMLINVFKSPYFIGEVLNSTAILTLTGLAFSLAYKTGMFNIGLSGQFLMGWISSVWFALTFPDMPKIIMLPLAIILGTVVGAIWAGIAGGLRAQFGTSEVVVTIMLNYIAYHINNAIIHGPLASPLETPIVGDNARLSLNALTTITKGSRLNLGFFLVVLVVIGYYWFMKRSTLGFEMKVVGLNSDSAHYAGINAKKNILYSMMASGALAGLAGVLQGLGTFGDGFIQTSMPQEGFNGIAVGLLGLGQSFGIFLSSLLFGILNVGSRFMPNGAGVPDEMAQVVIAAIIFFVGANYIIRYFLDKRQSKPATAQEAKN